MNPTTGHDVLEDIQHVFKFVAHQLSAQLDKLQVDPASIAVAGSSAGGLCAFLAATQAKPNPLQFYPSAPWVVIFLLVLFLLFLSNAFWKV